MSTDVISLTLTCVWLSSEWTNVRILNVLLFSVFNSSRGHAIERPNYLEDLQCGPKRR